MAERSPPAARTRPLVLALALLWALDALLELQPANFTSRLVYETVLGNAEHQPQPIYGSLVEAARLLAPWHAELNALIAVAEAGIAAGLLWPRTMRLALAASIPWSLGVWWLGEGFGGLFAGKATLLVGAPGAALLYALAALVAWPRRDAIGIRRGSVEPPPDGSGEPDGSLAAAGALGERTTTGAWVLLWVGGALLRVAPFWFPPVYALVGDLQLGLDEEPRWMARLNLHLSHLAAAAGLTLVVALALLEITIGILPLTRWRRAGLALGIAVSLLYWVIGQQLGGLFTGQSTDLSAAPLYVLIAVSLWPVRQSGRCWGVIRHRHSRVVGGKPRAYGPGPTEGVSGR